jgi:hypothetical protein
VDLEITPAPTEQERAAIEAAIAADAREERELPAPWAQELLPRREDDLEGQVVARGRNSFGALRA